MSTNSVLYIIHYICRNLKKYKCSSACKKLKSPIISIKDKYDNLTFLLIPITNKKCVVRIKVVNTLLYMLLVVYPTGISVTPINLAKLEGINVKI